MNIKHSAVIVTFADRRHADHFVEELQRAGFKKAEIGIYYPQGRAEEIEEDAVAGAITGGMVGVAAGAVALGLLPGVGPVLAGGLLAGGTAVGATTGGVLGALVGLGIPEDKVRQHEQEFLAGRTVVVVQALLRGGEALDILRRCETTLGIRVPPTLTGGAKSSFLKKLWRGRTAADYCTAGETCLVHGEYEEAVRDFNAAIRLDPHHATAYLDRGLAYEEEGQYQEAISDYDMALRLDPKHALAHVHRGNAWFALADFDQAIYDYTEAIHLDPDLAVAYYHRGLVFQEKGYADEAKADEETALRLVRKC